MRGIVLVLLLIAAAGVFVMFVTKTPFRTTRADAFVPKDVAETKETRGKADAKRDKRTSRQNTSVKANANAQPAVSTHDLDTPATVQVSASATSFKSIDRLKHDVLASDALTISEASVTLYAINSSRGRVVKILSKGTVVVPNIQIADSADNWTLVRVPDLNISGFVQTADLINLH